MPSPQPTNIRDAVDLHPEADKEFNVQGRGRPEREPQDAARRNLRRKHFGEEFRLLRERAGLTLSRAAMLAGLNSSRKLSQYETTCYPPGDVVARMAPHYRIEASQLAELVLSHSDPELFRALTGRPGYEPSKRAVDICAGGGVSEEFAEDAEEPAEEVAAVAETDGAADGELVEATEN